MKKFFNSKRFSRILSLIISALIILVVLYKVLLSSFVGGLILTGEKQEIYYDSVNDCISQRLKKVTETEAEKQSIYGDSLYVYEDENKYIEIFSDGNRYDIWLFVIDKVSYDNETKFKLNHCENCLQLSLDEWKSIENFNFLITENLDENEYGSNEFDITQFQMTTAQGKETLYLIIEK